MIIIIAEGFQRFMRETKLPSSELTGAVRQALVDISTRQETGLPLTDPTSLEDDRGFVSAEQAKIFQNKDGKILVRWATGDLPREPTQRKLTSILPNEQPEMGAEETRDVESGNLEPASAIGSEKPAESQLQNSATTLNEDILEPESTSPGVLMTEDLQDRALNKHKDIDVRNEPAQVREPISKDLTPFMRIRLEGDTLFAVSNPGSFEALLTFLC